MKYAFVDSNGVLIAWGFMVSNSGDTQIEVDLSFDLDIGKWKYVSGQWQAISP